MAFAPSLVRDWSSDVFFQMREAAVANSFKSSSTQLCQQLKDVSFLKFVANARTICIYSDWKDTLWINDLRLCCKFGQAGACCDAPRLAKAGSNQHYWSTGNWQLQYWQQQADLNLYREMKGASIHQTLSPSLSTPQASPLHHFQEAYLYRDNPVLAKIWQWSLSTILWKGFVTNHLSEPPSARQ